MVLAQDPSSQNLPTLHFDFGAAGSPRLNLSAFGPTQKWQVGNGMSGIDSAINAFELTLVVFRVQYDPVTVEDVVDFWFNSNPYLSAPDVTSTGVDYGTGGLASLNFYSSAFPFGGTLAVDEFRLGTSLDSILVPEPSLNALLVLGGIATLVSWQFGCWRKLAQTKQTKRGG